MTKNPAIRKRRPSLPAIIMLDDLTLSASRPIHVSRSPMPRAAAPESFQREFNAMIELEKWKKRINSGQQKQGTELKAKPSNLKSVSQAKTSKSLESKDQNSKAIEGNIPIANYDTSRTEEGTSKPLEHKDQDSKAFVGNFRKV